MLSPYIFPQPRRLVVELRYALLQHLYLRRRGRRAGRLQLLPGAAEAEARGGGRERGLESVEGREYLDGVARGGCHFFMV